MKSKGEKRICEILNFYKVPYLVEKTYSDLKHGVYRFDFFLPKQNILLEYDGEQHFQRIPRFHRTNSDFTKYQGHDRQKNSYCLANKIPLYRIPYWDLDKIIKIEDLFRPEYLVKTRWHNDDIWKKYNGR